MSKHDEVFKQLQSQYGNQVAWVDIKSTTMPSGYPWVMQIKWWFDMDKAEHRAMVRILRIGQMRNRAQGDWLTLDRPNEVKRAITQMMLRVANRPMRNDCKRSTAAAQQGRILLDNLSAVVHSCPYASGYYDVLIPMHDKRELSCLLKFEIWKGRDPHRRKWRVAANRNELYNSGKYAWTVMLDFNEETACIYYANCIKHKSKSEWFSWHELHENLLAQSSRADRGEWRIQEVMYEDSMAIAKELQELDPNDEWDQMRIAELEKQRRAMVPVLVDKSGRPVNVEPPVTEPEPIVPTPPFNNIVPTPQVQRNEGLDPELSLDPRSKWKAST